MKTRKKGLDAILMVCRQKKSLNLRCICKSAISCGLLMILILFGLTGEQLYVLKSSQGSIVQFIRTCILFEAPRQMESLHSGDGVLNGTQSSSSLIALLAAPFALFALPPLLPLLPVLPLPLPLAVLLVQSRGSRDGAALIRKRIGEATSRNVTNNVAIVIAIL